MVVHEIFVGFLLPEIFEGVGPEDVAHQALRRWLTETIDLHSGEPS